QLPLAHHVIRRGRGHRTIVYAQRIVQLDSGAEYVAGGQLGAAGPCLEVTAPGRIRRCGTKITESIARRAEIVAKAQMAGAAVQNRTVIVITGQLVDTENEIG